MPQTHRFFVHPDAIHGETIILPTDAAHHASNVLRLRVGEMITVHDGANRAYTVRLETVSPKNTTATVTDSYLLSTEPDLRITVAQALPKTSDKVEQVLQHGTEVGAAGFLFFAGVHSVARLAANEKIEKRLERWRGIVKGAAEQSGRGILPTVEWLPFARETAAAFAGYDAVLIAHETAANPLKRALDLLPTISTNLLIVIGPEGGFSPDEMALFVAAKGQPVSLGSRILRTETAALVMLAQILFRAESL